MSLPGSLETKYSGDNKNSQRLSLLLNTDHASGMGSLTHLYHIFSSNRVKCGGLPGKLGVEMATACEKRERLQTKDVRVSALSAQLWQYAEIN